MKNMKRIFSIITVLLLIFALCACNNNETPEVEKKSEKEFTELAIDGLGITFSYPTVWEVQAQAADGASFFYADELVGMYIRKLEVGEGLSFSDITDNTRNTLLGRYVNPTTIEEDKILKIDGRDACLFTYYESNYINPYHYTMVLILDHEANVGYQIELSSTEASAEVARTDFEDIINSIRFN